MKIPSVIKNEAYKNGFNNVEYLGMEDGSQVFVLSSIGDDGIAIPLGLPTLIMYKNGIINWLSGTEALSLFSRLV